MGEMQAGETQAGMLAPVPPRARDLEFGATAQPGADVAMQGLRGLADEQGVTRPINGAYFACPPMRPGRLDLRALGF